MYYRGHMSAIEMLPARRRNGSTATRRRIADAALALFSTRGYAATSLQAIADAASLHVQTIYQAYGSKPAVLEAACELARAGGEDPETDPAEWPWAKALIAEPDPARLLHPATHVRIIAPRAGPLVAEIPHDARRSRARVLLARIEAGRYPGRPGLWPSLVRRKPQRRGLDPARRRHDVRRQLVREPWMAAGVGDRAWAPDDYEHWLGETLCDLLLEPTAKK